MLDTPFPPWPAYSEEEADAVRGVLLSNRVNYWTGDETRAFEEEFAEATDARYAIALANGTVALEIALKALGVGAGDEVIVTPRSFIASASSVVSAGARPVFADIDRHSQNLTAATIRAAITPRTKAVIVVHLAGMPADMDPIMALAGEHGFHVIEDCAQAHGARYRGRSVGSISHVGVWSFCQDKIITTGGEGGMVTTSDAMLQDAMWSLKDHGKSWRAVNEPTPAPGFRWLHDSFGTNARMTELQGVIGRIQTRRLPAWHTRRLANATRIWEACRAIDWLRVPSLPPDVEHAAYKAYVFVRPERLPSGWTRDRVIAELVALGVPAYTGACAEIYLERAFDDTGLRPVQRLPIARELGETSLMFLVHPTLQDVHIARTVDALGTIASRVAAAGAKAASLDLGVA